jgi:hypothetical protein
MATTKITDLPGSRALDYRALSAIRGGLGDGNWVVGAFSPFVAAAAGGSILPIVNFYQLINISEITNNITNVTNNATNYIASNMTLQNQNINVQNSAANATIAVGAIQNALTMNLSH